MPEFPCTGPVTATIRMVAGDLRVIGEDRSDVSVDVRPGTFGEAARTAAESTIVEMSGDQLRIEVPQARGFIIRRTSPLNITVRVPAGSSLRIRSASADMVCEGRFADIDADSASGDLNVEHVTGDVKRKGASGDTRFTRIDGNLAAGKASGDIRGDRIGGNFASKSASGDITIDTIGGSVECTTASGDIRIGTLSRGTTRIGTASGDVTLGIAEGTGVWLDVNSVSGDVRSGLTATDATPGDGVAALTLNIRTVSGDIRLRRSTGSPSRTRTGRPTGDGGPTDEPTDDEPMDRDAELVPAASAPSVPPVPPVPPTPPTAPPAPAGRDLQD